MTLVGWCPGGRPVADMLARYPRTRVVRIFVGPGDPLPMWDGPILGPAVAAGALVHLSFKTWDPTALVALVDGKPDGLPLLLTFGHEPEQGPAEGDLPIDEWKARWADLVALLADHPKRDQVLLVPVYTRYWWQAHPGDLRWLLEVPVDAIGWDVYSNGTLYRAPDDLLSIPRAVAARTGLPYLIAELGAQRLPWDTDGAVRSAWMRAMVAAAEADGALTVCWYHKDGWDLGTPVGQPEQQTWQTIIREETPVATTAPDNLKAARTLLLDHLGPHGLEPLAVGIVGDPAHWGGYHCGRGRVVAGDYSVLESPRDHNGLTEDASALDVGQFSYRSPDGTVHDLRSFSRWATAQCQAGAADTRDIREVIYSPDGRTVRRWDRLGRRTTGDSSHLGHTHFSFFRDAIKAGRDQTPLFRRYLTAIGLLEDDMPTADEIATAVLGRTYRDYNLMTDGKPALRTVAAILMDARTDAAKALTGLRTLGELVARESASPDEVRALLDALPQPAPPVDVDELAGLVADRVLAALPAADGPVSREDLEGALRDVLGSLDGATPQG